MISNDTVVTYLMRGLLTRHSRVNIGNGEVLMSGSSAEDRIECVVMWLQ